MIACANPLFPILLINPQHNSLVQKSQDTKYQGVSLKIASSSYDRQVAPMNSQQHKCLGNTQSFRTTDRHFSVDEKNRTGPGP